MADGLLDAKYAYEIAVIQDTYGDAVSFDRKRKALRKFGENYDIDTGVREQVWYTGGDEILPTTNAIDRISSSDAGDTQTIHVEGHYYSDTDLVFHVQEAVLDGQNSVTLAQPLARCTRTFNKGDTETAGDVYVYQNTATVGGVPSDITKIHVTQPAEYQQTLKCATSISYQDYWLITSATFSVLKATATSVEFTIWVRQQGGVFLPRATFGVGASGSPFQKIMTSPFIVPKNSDVKVTAESITNNVGVTAILEGYLGVIIG